MDIVERLRTEPELTPAQYWEVQADMWHQNYKEAINEIKWLREALQTIVEEGSGWGQSVALAALKRNK